MNSVSVSCDFFAVAGDFVVLVVMNVDSVVVDGKCADVDSGDLTGNPFKSRMEKNAKEIYISNLNLYVCNLWSIDEC